MTNIFKRVDKLEQRIQELESELRQAKYKYDTACFKKVGDWIYAYHYADPRPEVSAIQLINDIMDANGMELKREFPDTRQYSIVKKEQQ